MNRLVSIMLSLILISTSFCFGGYEVKVYAADNPVLGVGSNDYYSWSTSLGKAAFHLTDNKLCIYENDKLAYIRTDVDACYVDKDSELVHIKGDDSYYYCMDISGLLNHTSKYEYKMIYTKDIYGYDCPTKIKFMDKYGYLYLVGNEPRHLNWITRQEFDSLPASYDANPTGDFTRRQVVLTTIEFDSNGGSSGPDREVEVELGETYTIPTEKPIRSGYKFTGWSTNSKSSVGQYKPGDSIVINNEQGIKLYACWDVKTYTVYIYEDDGRSQIYTYKEFPFRLPYYTSEKEGCEFLGWSDSRYSETVKYMPGDEINEEIDEETTLYPVWKDNNYYSIAYNPNGGIGGPSSTKVKAGDSFTISSITPSREGYEFQGWSIDGTMVDTVPGDIYYIRNGSVEQHVSNYQGTRVKPLETSLKNNGKILLYAVWSKKKDADVTTEAPKVVVPTTEAKTTEDSTTEAPISRTKKTPSITAPSKKKLSFATKSYELSCITDADTHLTYKSSDTSVVKVSDTGVVTVKGYGEAVITVTSPETDAYYKAKEFIDVTIVPSKLSGFKVTSPRKKEIKLTWRKTSKENIVEIQASKTSSFKKRKVKKEKGSKGKMLISAKHSGTKYYIKARAVVTKKGEKHYSDWVIKKVRVK